LILSACTDTLGACFHSISIDLLFDLAHKTELENHSAPNELARAKGERDIGRRGKKLHLLHNAENAELQDGSLAHLAVTGVHSRLCLLLSSVHIRAREKFFLQRPARRHRHVMTFACSNTAVLLMGRWTGLWSFNRDLDAGVLSVAETAGTSGTERGIVELRASIYGSRNRGDCPGGVFAKSAMCPTRPLSQCM